MPLVSGDSGLQEVNRRQASFTSHNFDQNFGVSGGYRVRYSKV